MEETSVLIERAQKGESEAREVLIEKNLGLVRHIVKRFVGRGVESDDLFQIGTIGLIKAIDKFDLSVGVAFSTYAVPLIMGEIRRFLRDDGLVKVSRTIKENSAKLAGVREELSGKLGREPLLTELMEKTGLGREDVIMALEAGNCVESLEGGTESEDGSSFALKDRITADPAGGSPFAGSRCGSADPEKDRLLDRLLLEQLLEELPAEDRKLILLRYYRDKSQVQTAAILGISQVQVSRKEKKILERLREKAIS